MNAYAEHLRGQLPLIGDTLAGGFQSLHDSPELPGCEALAECLRHAVSHVQRLAEAVRAGDPPTV